MVYFLLRVIIYYIGSIFTVPYNAGHRKNNKELYKSHLIVLLLLHEETFSSFSAFQAKKDENGASFFLKRKSTFSNFKQKLEKDISSFSDGPTMVSVKEILKDEIGHFVALDKTVALKYPVLCSFAIEMSSVYFLSQVSFLSKQFPESSHFIKYVKKESYNNLKEIISILFFIASDRDIRKLFLSFLNIFSSLYAILSYKISVNILSVAEKSNI